MRTPTEMRSQRRRRIEYVLLGMLLAREGDRDAILERLDPWDVGSDLIVDCIRAVKESDPQPVRDTFKQWGVDIGGGMLLDAMLRYVSEAGREERAEEVLAELKGRLSLSGTPEDRIKCLEYAVKEIRRVCKEHEVTA